jgi:IPT/TIG domain
MRTSTSTRSRLTRAGIATGAVSATLLFTTAVPAFAADVAVTPSPTTVGFGGGGQITVTGTNVFLNITAPGARFVAASGTCAGTYGSTSATNPAVAITKNSGDDNGGTITAPNLALGEYKICLYAGTASTSALAGHSNANVKIVAASAPAVPNAGPATAGTALTLTGTTPFVTGVSTVGATFALGNNCPATYTGTGNVAATVTKLAGATAVVTVTTPTLVAPNTYNVCVYNGTGSTSALIGATTYTALPSVTLSPPVGPTGGGNTITATSPVAFLAGITPGAEFTRDNCPAHYATSPATGVFNAATITKISSYKVAVLVPGGVALDTNTSEATAAYNLCLYSGNGNSDVLVAAPGTYTVAPILSISNVTPVSPAGGPAQGGSVVTINGGGFPTAPDALITASIGGAPLEHIQVAPNGNSLTGTTTAHAPGAASVSVTTAAGTKTTTTTPFTYSYGIQIAPKTAANTDTVFLDVNGVGFAGMTFGTVGHTTGTHVFLVNDRYDPTGTTNWTNAPVDECTSVLPISDTELICTLDLSKTSTTAGPLTATPVADGTYTVEIVPDATPGATLAAGSYSIISSGSTFTVAPY